MNPPRTNFKLWPAPFEAHTEHARFTVSQTLATSCEAPVPWRKRCAVPSTQLLHHSVNTKQARQSKEREGSRIISEITSEKHGQNLNDNFLLPLEEHTTTIHQEIASDI